MSKRLPGQLNLWTSYVEVSPAKMSALRARGLALMVLEAASGLNSLELLKRSVRAGSSSKMSQAGQSSGSIPSAENWESKAMQLFRSRFRHLMSDLHKSEKEFLLLPTPSAASAIQGVNHPDGKRGQTLIGAARGQIWPTPKASPSGPDYKRASRPGSGGDDLATAVARWPTPRASCRDMGTLMMSKHSGTSRKAGNPDAQYDPANGGQLNPPWVEWLMGFPIGWTDYGL